MAYESFNNSKIRFQKIWEKSEDNLTNINDVPLIKLDFNSINFNKKIVTIPIVTDKLFNLFTEDIQTILLENFPEWVINMIEVNCIYTIEDAFTAFPIVDNFQEASDNGTLKVEDISIVRQEFNYWFNNVDNVNYNLKIFLSGIVRQISELRPNMLPAFLQINVPLFVTISLKIVNQRIYETMNSHKE